MNHDSHYASYPPYRRDKRVHWLLTGLVVVVLGAAIAVRPSSARDGEPDNCHTLTRTHAGQGDDPTAAPANSQSCPDGQYTAGEEITLTAAPDVGWHVSGWSGTTNDSSTATTNTVAMPDEDYTVSVTYEQDETVCYRLTLTHVGNGTDPTAEPNKSPDCADNHYIAEAQLTLTAAPDEGWHVKSWTGTTDDDSTATTNTLTMPNAAHQVAVTYEEISLDHLAFLSAILGDWPQWQKVGSTELTSLYTVGLCPDDLTERFAATRDALYSWVEGDWEVMPGAPANVRDFLFLNDCTVYAASFDGGVWQLIDDTWEQVGTNPLPTARSLALRGTELYVGSRDGVFRYDTESATAASWEHVLTGSNVTRLSRSGDRLFAADFGLGARYNDICDDTTCTWTPVGAAPFGDAFDVVGSATGTPPDWLVLATARGIYRWDGSAWDQPSAPPQPAGNVFALAVVGEWVFAGVQNGGVWLSTDFGDTWGLFEESPLFTIIDLVVVPGDGLYAVTPNDGIWHYPVR